MKIELNEGLVSNRLEAVNLARFDHEDITGPRFEFLAVDIVGTATRLNELDFIVWMSVRSRTATCLSIKQKNADVHIAVVSADKIV